MNGRPCARLRTCVLSVHVVLSAVMGIAALLYPESLIVYASEEQSSLCSGCTLAYDLARCFGIVNLFVALVAASLAVPPAAEMEDGVVPLRIIRCLALMMLLNALLRVAMIASGRVSSMEWTSLAASVGLLCGYYFSLTSCPGRGGMDSCGNADRVVPRVGKLD